MWVYKDDVRVPGKECSVALKDSEDKEWERSFSKTRDVHVGVLSLSRFSKVTHEKGRNKKKNF